MFKKRLGIALCCLTLVAALSGCAGTGNNNTDTPSGTDEGEATGFEGQTLTVLMSKGDSDSDAIRAEIAAFENKYGVTVEIEETPGADEGENIMKIRIATNAMPDIMYSSVGSKLLDLNPVENFIDLSGRDFLDNMDEGYLAAVTVDGGVYGIPPSTATIAGVFYNKTVFEDLSLDIPLTWEQFLQTCDTIKNNSDVHPTVASYEQTGHTQIPFLMNYYYVQNEIPDFAELYTKNEIGLSDTPVFVRGMQKMYDIAVNEYIDPDYLATGFDVAARKLAEGEGAMFITRSNVLTNIYNMDAEAVENIGFFPLPDEDPDVRGVALWLPPAFVATKSAENPELAIAFLEFMTTDEAMDAYFSTMDPTGVFVIKGATLPDSSYSALKEAQEWLDRASSPVMEYFSPIKGSNQASICMQAASGMITPVEAIEELEKDNAIFAAQLGLENW